MIWNFIVSIRVLKAKRFTAEDTLVFFSAIERALDLGSEYDDGFLLVNPRNNKYHMQYSTKSGNFDLADYSKTELPQNSTRQLELSFSFFSPYEEFWSANIPIPSLQDACKSFNGKCFPDSFKGEDNSLLGIITEVDLTVLPRDAVEKLLEKEFEVRFGEKTQFRLRKSLMGFKDGSKSQATEIIQVYGRTREKSIALGFISSFFIQNGLKSLGFKRAEFTPMNMLAGPTNTNQRALILKAHKRFILEHKTIMLRNVLPTNWSEDASSEVCKDVLSKEYYMKDNLKLTSLYDLFFSYLIDTRSDPVAVGKYSPGEGSTTVFVVVPTKRMNNTFEAIHNLNRSSSVSIFFHSPIDRAFPPECLAYLSKGVDKASRQAVASKEKQRIINLQRDFPTLQSNKKPNQPPTVRAQNKTSSKSYSAATSPSAPPAQRHATPRNDPKIAALNTENERLQQRIRELEQTNTALKEQLADREENLTSLNKSMSDIFSLYSSLLNHLKLDPSHYLQTQLRRNSANVEECRIFQQERDAQEFTPLDEKRSDESHAGKSSKPHKEQTSSLARSSVLQISNQAHFSGQKRDLSPSHKQDPNSKRSSTPEDGSSVIAMDTDSTLHETGALGSPEASEMQ